MLIDAGTTNAGSTVSNYLKNLGITTLDIVIATHPHEDHIGGMATVLNNFKVNQFIDSGYPHTTSTYENMLNSIDKKNIPFQTVKTGDIIVFDPAISISVLNPQDSFMNDINANSVVLKLTYGKTSFLFMGDAATDVEDRIAGAALNVDILKVAHHGSSSSSGSAFLAKVTPAVSIIEVGAGNSYGYPAAATLSRLQQIGSKVYRTDLDGTIKVTSDGNSYNVITTAG